MLITCFIESLLLITIHSLLTHPSFSAVFPLVHDPPTLLPPLFQPPFLPRPRSHRRRSVDCYTGMSSLPIFQPPPCPNHVLLSYSLDRVKTGEALALLLIIKIRVSGSNRPISSSSWAGVLFILGCLWRDYRSLPSTVGFWGSWLPI